MVEPLRALLLPVACLPWTIGGREVYAHSLAKHLRELGCDARIAFHQNLNTAEPLGDHDYDAVPITVLPSIPGQQRRSAVYACLPDGVPGFEDLLARFEPQVVHLHDFSVSANLLHIRLAKQTGAHVVMTYHSPGQSCTQRSLLYRGKEICDGEILPVRCTECRMSAMGAPFVLGSALGAFRSSHFNPEKPGVLSRALTARVMTDRFIAAWRSMVAAVDRIHVYADWAAELMKKNGVPREKIILFRTGLPSETPAAPRHEHPGDRLRLCFFGRCDPVKGVHVLVEAVKLLPGNVSVEVSFFGPYWNTAYGRKLLRTMEGDTRFKEPKVLAQAEIQEALANADACVVPSTWLETGPLVVLEAFFAGVPVIGSRLGGIAELVSDGVDGLLFPPGDAAELAKILQGLALNPSQLHSLRQGIPKPRTMRDLAREVLITYNHLLNGRPETSYVGGQCSAR